MTLGRHAKQPLLWCDFCSCLILFCFVWVVKRLPRIGTLFLADFLLRQKNASQDEI